MIGCVPQLLSADATLTGREIGTPAHLGLDLMVLVAAPVVGVTAAAALLPRLAR
jgi:hypothetical protein